MVRVRAGGGDRTHVFYWIYHVLLFICISLLEPAHLSPPTHSDQGASSPVLQLQCDPPGSGPEPQGAPGEEDPCLATTQRSQTEFLVLSKVLHRIVCVGGGGYDESGGPHCIPLFAMLPLTCRQLCWKVSTGVVRLRQWPRSTTSGASGTGASASRKCSWERPGRRRWQQTHPL